MKDKRPDEAGATALQAIVNALVDYWGAEVVAACVERSAHGAAPISGARISRASSSRPQPTELVRRLGERGRRRDALERIASAFEKKRFLPTSSDVAEFLQMRGVRLVTLKSRSDGFRPLLKLLLTLSDQELLAIADSDLYGGPTSLGPLSDAIRAAGADLRGPHDGNSE